MPRRFPVRPLQQLSLRLFLLVLLRLLRLFMRTLLGMTITAAKLARVPQATPSNPLLLHQ